jgi:hypothetical protein
VLSLKIGAVQIRAELRSSRVRICPNYALARARDRIVVTEATGVPQSRESSGVLTQTGIPTHRPIRRVVERVLAFRVDPPVKTSNFFVGYYLDRYRSCMDMLCAESARFYRRLLSDGRSTISEQNNDTCGSLSHSSKRAAG